jgi:hypothetical protein
MPARLALTLALVSALAAAPAAAAAPAIGRTATVAAVGGKVLVKARGSSTFRRLRGVRSVRIGSTVDSTNGQVRVTTASNRRGGTQSGVFHGGVFTIAQKRSSPLTELRLAGADGCGAAPAGSARAARVSRRRLFGRAHGQFRTRGRQSSATVRGTVWATEDLCNGATLTRAYSGGKVDARTRTSKQTLKPGESSEDYCGDRGAPGVSDLYCMSLFSDPANDVFGFAIVTYDPGALGQNPPAPGPREVDVCIRNPLGVERCNTYALESIGGGAFLQSDGCTPGSGTGVYSIRWRLGGTDLPVPLSYVSTHAGSSPGCVNRPSGEPPPKALASRR